VISYSPLQLSYTWSHHYPEVTGVICRVHSSIFIANGAVFAVWHSTLQGYSLAYSVASDPVEGSVTQVSSFVSNHWSARLPAPFNVMSMSAEALACLHRRDTAAVVTHDYDTWTWHRTALLQSMLTLYDTQQHRESSIQSSPTPQSVNRLRFLRQSCFQAWPPN